MSLSGSTSWSLQAQDIVNAALRKLGVLSGNATPETYQVTNAIQALNALIKGFYADGMPVWAIQTYTFTTVQGTPQYLIGPGQTFNTDMPLKVLQAWRNQSGNYSNIPMNIYTNYNYDLLPLTNSSGTPVNLYYQPFETYGAINLWPKPNDSVTAISIRYQVPFEDIVNLTDNLDFPSYWTEAIIYNLAQRLAPEYGIPLMDRQVLTQEAEKHHQNALGFGVEEGSFYFQPDTAGQRSN